MSFRSIIASWMIVQVIVIVDQSTTKTTNSFTISHPVSRTSRSQHRISASSWLQRAQPPSVSQRTRTTTRARSSSSSSALQYWFCDDNDCYPIDNGGEEKIRREFEEMERARMSFEALIQNDIPPTAYSSTGISIQDDGILHTTTNYAYSQCGNRNELSSSMSSSLESSSSFSSSSSTSFGRSSAATTPKSKDDALHTDRLLTSAGRLIREAEIRLLESLIYHEKAAEALIQFWTTERDSFAATDLLVMSSQHTRMSDNLVNEQIMLETMIETYPTWAEPYCRLASLRYYKGHYGLAEQYAMKALELKPWHFEAIQLLVTIYLNTGNDDDALKWARRKLPRADEPTRRKVWCQSAIEAAKKQLHDAEQYTNEYYYNQRRAADLANRKQLQPDEVWQ